MDSANEGSKKRVGNLNNLIQPLLTDKYQVSMCYAYWRDGKHNDSAVFDLFFRKNPFQGEYTIFAGLDECLRYIENFKFTQRDIDYLKSIPDYLKIEEAFWTYMLSLDASQLRMLALREGSVCFSNLPLARLEGPLGLLQLLETALLNLINYASLVATNAARFKMSAIAGNMAHCRLLEFGLRRAQGPDGGFSGSRYSYIGGFDATSNLLAGRELGIPVSGTQSHAFIMAYFGSARLARDDATGYRFLFNRLTQREENFTLKVLDMEQRVLGENFLDKKASSANEPSELKAFTIFAWAFPENFLALIDTYDVIRSGLVNFSIVAMALLEFGYKPIGVRIDSGDLAYLSRCSRNLFSRVEARFNLSHFSRLEIVASNDINEATITSLSDQSHAITCLGIGTHLVTCQNQPALGCVYKLVETGGRPCMKLSSTPGKISIPCRKTCYRLFGKDGKALLDLLVPDCDGTQPPEPGKRILCRHPFEAEKRCYVTPSRVEPLLQLFWDGGPVLGAHESALPAPKLEEARAHCLNSLELFTDDIKRSLNPTPYKVSVSEALFALLTELRLNLTPIGELS